MGAQILVYNQPWSQLEVSTAGATITLPLSNRQQREFIPSADITAPKTWAVIDEGFGKTFRFPFVIDGLHIQTMPANFKMSDPLWDSVGKTWTPIDIGEYYAEAKYDDANEEWFLTIIGPIV